MVHGLETLKVLNGRRISEGLKGTKESIPGRIALNPFLARRHANRPWTDAETGGCLFIMVERKDPGEKGLREGIRG